MKTPVDYINAALDAFDLDMKDFVEARLRTHYGYKWQENLPPQVRITNSSVLWDTQALTNTAIKLWHEVFHDQLGYTGRNLIGEIKEWRNEVAHRTLQHPLNYDDAFRAVDTVWRLLSRAQLPQALAVQSIKDELTSLNQAKEDLTGSGKLVTPSPSETVIRSPRIPRPSLATDGFTNDKHKAHFVDAALQKSDFSSALKTAREIENISVADESMGKIFARAIQLNELAKALVAARGIQNSNQTNECLEIIVTHAIQDGKFGAALVAAREIRNDWLHDASMGKIVLAAVETKKFKAAQVAAKEIKSAATADAYSGFMVDALSGNTVLNP